MISAIARQYHDTQITLPVFQSFRQLVLHHVQNQYQVLSLSNLIVLQAIQLMNVIGYVLMMRFS